MRDEEKDSLWIPQAPTALSMKRGSRIGRYKYNNEKNYHNLHTSFC